MLALFARRPCHSRLLSLRYLASEAADTTPAEAGSPAHTEEASSPPNSLGRPTGAVNNFHVAGQLWFAKAKALYPAGTARLPAWWADSSVNAYGAYRIIQNRFKKHGSQSQILFVRFPHPSILPGALQHDNWGCCRGRELQATDKQSEDATGCNFGPQYFGSGEKSTGSVAAARAFHVSHISGAHKGMQSAHLYSRHTAYASGLMAFLSMQIAPRYQCL